MGLSEETLDRLCKDYMAFESSNWSQFGNFTPTQLRTAFTEAHDSIVSNIPGMKGDISTPVRTELTQKQLVKMFKDIIHELWKDE